MVFTSDPDIKFGTSGLRGPASGFTNKKISAYVGAFLKNVGRTDGLNNVYISADLRESSPRITKDCIAAARAAGWFPIYAGNVPTPALASYALERNCPAIMVTGSHVPDNYNGIKFYRRNGELLKDDEEPISRQAQKMLETDLLTKPVSLPPVDADIARSYVARYISAYSAETLKGLRVGIDLHSAVGRDLLVEILEALGATCFAFRRSDKFIAVDTEALSEADIERARGEIKQHGLCAVISTDGDGDRPLVIDEKGNQINGDVLGALSARHLRVKTIVTPLSSTSAIELSGWFNKIVRTRVGSPYVVASMAREAVLGSSVAGFEANGGFLLETDVKTSKGSVSRLPTRDAVLPIIAVLDAANVQSISISALADSLPARYMKAGLIRQVADREAQLFLTEILSSQVLRTEVDARLARPEEIDSQDGVRMIFADSTIVHLRQSGNAPEMRCYVETGDKNLTSRMLNEIMCSLRTCLGARGAAA